MNKLENQEVHYYKDIINTTIYEVKGKYGVLERFKDSSSLIATFDDKDKVDKIYTEVYNIKGKWYVATRWSVAYKWNELDEYYGNLDKCKH